jgi:hypothetical protein
MDEEIYIAFDRYLDNEMPDDERIEFEDRLYQNAAIREKFELYKETTLFLNHKFEEGTAAFKENLQVISNKHFTETKPQKTKVIRFNPWITGLAASLVLFIGTWAFLQNQDPEYSDYNNHEMAMFVERGSADTDLNAAQNSFNDKKYDKAVEAFSKINMENSAELQYFYAIALLETSDFTKSDLLLNAILSGNSVYKYKAAWYLALSKLKQENTGDCKMILEQIPPEAEDYEKARELFDDLD